MALQKLSALTYLQVKNIGNKIWNTLTDDEKLSVYNIAQQRICNLRNGYEFDTAEYPQTITSVIVETKKYAAMLSQYGTNNPTVTVSANNLGVTIDWTRSSVGVYVGTLSSSLVVANVYPSAFVNRLNPIANETHVLISMVDSTHIRFIVMDSGYELVDGFNNLRVEITYYL